MSTHSRVTGHTLRSGGAPFELRSDGSTWRVFHDGYEVSGTGRGVCSCGSYGPIMSSVKQRKLWHRKHKDAT